jgi:hypothetical protein
MERIQFPPESHLHSAGYDPSAQVLEVAFKDFKTGAVRSVWQYLQVPPITNEELHAAEHPGKYFNEHIKGVFDGHRVD